LNIDKLFYLKKWLISNCCIFVSDPNHDGQRKASTVRC